MWKKVSWIRTYWQGLYLRWFFKIVDVSENHIIYILRIRVLDLAGEWYGDKETSDNKYKGQYFIRVHLECVPLNTHYDFGWEDSDGYTWAFFYGRNHLSALLKCYAALTDTIQL
jgi:hypothetical protein